MAWVMPEIRLGATVLCGASVEYKPLRRCYSSSHAAPREASIVGVGKISELAEIHRMIEASDPMTQSGVFSDETQVFILGVSLDARGHFNEHTADYRIDVAEALLVQRVGVTEQA